MLRNWKETKKKQVSLNFNSFIETTLGQDAVMAYNNMYTKYGGEPKKLGETWKTQLHRYCQIMAPAFEKMVGSYQGIAFPFEIRMTIEELHEVKEVWDVNAVDILISCAATEDTVDLTELL